MICTKILGKVTKFGGKRTPTLGVANRYMGFIGLILKLNTVSLIPRAQSLKKNLPRIPL